MARHIDPDFEGRRLKGDETNEIYLVLDGVLRHIENPKVYESLYGDQDFKYETEAQALIDNYEKGAPIVQEPSLIKDTNDSVFLIDEGKTRPIKNMDIFNRYHFSGKNILTIGTLVTLIPNGPYVPEI